MMGRRFLLLLLLAATFAKAEEATEVSEMTLSPDVQIEVLRAELRALVTATFG